MRLCSTVESGHDVKPGFGEGKSRGREAAGMVREKTAAWVGQRLGGEAV